MGFIAVGGEALGARALRMTPMLEPVLTCCPYCGEPIEVLVDSSVESQHYIEDCQVCCRGSAGLELVTSRVVADGM